MMNIKTGQETKPDLALSTEVTGNGKLFLVKTWANKNSFGTILHYDTLGKDMQDPDLPEWRLPSRSLLTAHSKMVVAFFTYGTLPLALLQENADSKNE